MEFVRSLMMSFQQFYIYGAGIVASGVYSALWELYGIRPDKFVTTAVAGNPNQIDGIPVITVDEAWDNATAIFWIVAVPEIHHNAIGNMLLGRGIHSENILYVSSKFENLLMDGYFRSKGYVTVSDFGEEMAPVRSGKSVEVYQAKCHLDSVLKEEVILPAYVKPIQVGAVLTEKRIAQLTDNMYKDNISFKNGNYCELTATYHAWKHSDADYKGICHYRRMFDLDEEMVYKIIESGTDVILPYPTVHYPNIKTQHSRYINDWDWNAMRQAVEEIQPEYGAVFDRVFSGQYFNNFNMLIARREVFDDYSSMLFAVLKKAEELTEPKGKERSDRFAGYMGENLTTLYFAKNRDKLRSVFVGKLWYV